MCTLIKYKLKIIIMKIKSLIIVSVLGAILFAFTVKPIDGIVIQEGETWVVPANFVKMKNPVAGDAEATDIGKELYNKHCKSCHGAKGLGDGSKAAELETPSGDFSTEEFHSQTDGEIFYKTKEGRDEMPSFKKKIAEDEDIWSIVNYVRTMNKS